MQDPPSIRLPSFQVLSEPSQSRTGATLYSLGSSITMETSETLASTSAPGATVAQNTGQGRKKTQKQAKQSQRKAQEKMCDEMLSDLRNTLVNNFLQDGGLTRPRDITLSQILLIENGAAQITDFPDIVCIFCRQSCHGLVEALQHLRLDHGLNIPDSALSEALAMHTEALAFQNNPERRVRL